MKKPVVIWPRYDSNDKKLLQDGSIDGVPMKEVWRQCQRESKEWFKGKIKNDPNFKKIMNGL